MSRKGHVLPGNDRFSFSPRGSYSQGFEVIGVSVDFATFHPGCPLNTPVAAKKPSVSSQLLLYVVASVDVAMRVDLFRRKTATNDRNRNLKGKGSAAVVVAKKQKRPAGRF